MNYHQIPTITRRQHRYVGNTLVGCTALLWRVAIAAMALATFGCFVITIIGGLR